MEGTLERFATLDDDMNLGKFSAQAKNYEKLHNLSLLVRNYNSVVCNADKHLHDKDYPKELMDIISSAKSNFTSKKRILFLQLSE